MRRSAPAVTRRGIKAHGRKQAMLVIVGYLIVLASVLGGFALAGGHMGALMQPVEMLMIGGAATGAFVVGNSVKTVKATLGAIPTLFKGSKYTKALYMELMALL